MTVDYSLQFKVIDKASWKMKVIKYICLLLNWLTFDKKDKGENCAVINVKFEIK